MPTKSDLSASTSRIANTSLNVSFDKDFTHDNLTSRKF